MLVYFIISAAVLIADQGVKAWAATFLKPVGSMPLIENVFHFTYTENEGAAFSILSGQRWFFIITFLAAMGVLVYLLKGRYFKTPLSKWAIALIFGGAAGNFIDRLRMGYVVDMFEFRFISFAIFNVADVALTFGVALMIIYILRYKEPAKTAQGEVKPNEQDDSARSA